MKTIRVVAAIIIDDGKVFATQRGYGEFKDGWEFPGGKMILAKHQRKHFQRNKRGTGYRSGSERIGYR